MGQGWNWEQSGFAKEKGFKKTGEKEFIPLIHP